jgi:hypothetical protein
MHSGCGDAGVGRCSGFVTLLIIINIVIVIIDVFRRLHVGVGVERCSGIIALRISIIIIIIIIIIGFSGGIDVFRRLNLGVGVVCRCVCMY